MAEATLGLGGNQGDVAVTLNRAFDLLSARGVTVLRRSSNFLTPPWGKTDQPPFVNAVALVETALEPLALLDVCLGVEAELGRVRLERWGPRVIDIDVLTYEGRRIDSERLTVPHPLMLERGFVLIPLAEVAPDLIVAGASVREHAGRFAAEAIEKLPQA